MKQCVDLKKIVILGLLASLLTFALGLMSAQVTTEIGTVNSSFALLATKLGIKQATAGLIIDLVSGGSTLWSIVAAVAGISGAGLIAIGGITAIKAVIKKSGRDFAIAW